VNIYSVRLNGAGSLRTKDELMREQHEIVDKFLLFPDIPAFVYKAL